MSSIFAKLLGREQRAIPYDESIWRHFKGLMETATGIDVTPDVALTYGAVYRAVDLLSSHIAMLPFRLMERTNGQMMKADAHPLYQLLHRQPNPEMTSYNWRKALMTHVLLWGNHYSEIEWSQGGRVLALWPLYPDRMRMERVNGSLVYYYRPSVGGPEQPVDPMRILHVRGMTLNGLTGLSVIGYARETVGLGLATQEFGSRFFGNDARPGGILQHPGQLSDGAHKRLLNSWESKHQGLDNSHKTAILEEGMEYKQIGIPPEDAQFLETRKFQVTEIARWFGLPPHKLMDLERSTFSNIEHQAIEYVQDSLQPWATNLETAVDAALLSEREQGRYYSHLLLDALLRGDMTARHQAYTSGIQYGYYSVNDVRQLENLNPIGKAGDTHLVPLNLISLQQASQPIQSAEREAVRPEIEARDAGKELRNKNLAAARQRIQRAYLPMYTDVTARILRREINDVGAAARKMLGQRNLFGFTDWLDTFYLEHRQFVIDQMRPLMDTFADLIASDARQEVNAPDDDGQGLADFKQSYLETYAVRHTARSQAAVEAAVASPDEGLQTLDDLWDEWRDGRPQSIAQEETVRAANGVAKAVYILAGIQVMRWVSIGDTCPYCVSLNGRVASVDKWFIAAGEEFLPDAPNGPLRVSRNVGHPPAHRGCDCMVIAG